MPPLTNVPRPTSHANIPRPLHDYRTYRPYRPPSYAQYLAGPHAPLAWPYHYVENQDPYYPYHEYPLPNHIILMNQWPTFQGH